MILIRIAPMKKTRGETMTIPIAMAQAIWRRMWVNKKTTATQITVAVAQ